LERIRDSTPRPAICAISAGVKWRPAVGAATEPRRRAKIVWYRSRSAGVSCRLMYGGSGTWPSASTSASTSPPDSALSLIVRRP
jgi:hypothetical protein